MQMEHIVKGRHETSRSAGLRRFGSITYTLATTDFRLRYAGSALGYLWSLSKPLLLFGILYWVFQKLLRFGTGVSHYPLQLLLGIVLWSFFTEATQGATTVLVARGDMIRKISFPTIALPISVGMTAFIAMVFNLIAVAGFIMWGGVTPTLSWLLLIPLIAELCVLTVGMSFLLSALFVRFRDVGQIWELALQLLFYGTPIIYPLTLVPEHLRALIMLNPLAQIIQVARQVVIAPNAPELANPLNGLAVLAPHLLVGGILVLGLLVFRSTAPQIAESI